MDAGVACVAALAPRKQPWLALRPAGFAALLVIGHCFASGDEWIGIPQYVFGYWETIFGNASVTRKLQNVWVFLLDNARA